MKKQNGITLIALIITIIVMIILVGVTINVAINGGLFNTAQQAAKGTGVERDREILLSAVVASLDGQLQVDGERLENNLPQGWTVEGSGPYTCTSPTGNKFTVDNNGNIIKDPELTGEKLLDTNYTLEVGTQKITIPEGFGIVDTTGETEVLLDNIEDYETYITANLEAGIVIQDANENEFVWIPVENPVLDLSSTVILTTEPCNASEDNWTTINTAITNAITISAETKYPMAAKVTVQKEGEAAKQSYVGIAYTFSETDGEISGFEDTTVKEPFNLTYKQELTETDVQGTNVPAGKYLLDSQEMFTVYGGGTYTETIYQTEYNQMMEKVIKSGGFYVGRYETGGFNESVVVSKPDREGRGDTCYITWYEAYKMQKDFAKNSDIIGSSMMWGSQADQVMIFVNGKNDGKGVKFNVYKEGSRGSNSSDKTGNNIADKVANIYDLEGNKKEATQESLQSIARIQRGGTDYPHYPAATRFNYGPSTNYSGGSGSRMTLYIK